MPALIEVIGNRAVVNANEGELVTFLDHWTTQGYLSSLITSDNQYMIGKVIYDLTKVPISKVHEVAQKIDAGEFSCPVCQRMATQSVDNNGDGEPLKEEKEEEPVLKEKPKPKEEVKEPELELGLDEVEIIELERERAIQKIVSAMDEVLLYKMMV